jgi:hypothetical protein
MEQGEEIICARELKASPERRQTKKPTRHGKTEDRADQAGQRKFLSGLGTREQMPDIRSASRKKENEQNFSSGNWTLGSGTKDLGRRENQTGKRDRQRRRPNRRRTRKSWISANSLSTRSKQFLHKN